MTTFTDRLMDHFRPADLLDIAIVSVLMYVVFVWLRDRASRSLFIVAVALGVIFLLARWLDLYLTTMFFQYGLVGIVLALVVVFQNDIRYGFERLTASRWFRRSSTDGPSRRMLATITEAVSEMAEKRIGALIVFPGREALDRHLRGGIAVDANISPQLLLSIFHSESPGHDGAVLIEQNRIAFLGLHLPLTTQISKIRDGGTRHAAALGLAECCDALAIAVSEERGTITIAHDGVLKVVESVDVANQLTQFFDNQNSDDHRTREPSWSDGLTKLIAAVAAVTLWFLFAFHTDTIQRTFVVPIEYRNLPQQFEIADPKPTYAELTLSGSEPAFNQLEPAKLAVSLEIAGVGDRRVLDWNTAPNVVNVTKDLSIENIVPRLVAITLREKGSK